MKVNKVSLFFGMAMVIVLIAVALGSVISNVVSVRSVEVPSELQGNSVAQEAANQTTAVHQKAMNILVTMAVFAIVTVFLIVIITAVINRRTINQIKEIDRRNQIYRQN